jgi:hypothetical protein
VVDEHASVFGGDIVIEDGLECIGPIPPHVRRPAPPRLALVEDTAAETKHDGEVASFVDLSPPELPAVAHRRVDGATVRAIVIVVAAIVSTALVGLLA